MDLAPLLTGLGFGALLASQVGPMWLLCARTAARFGFVAGAWVGAGVAAVDVLYAILGTLGAGALLQAPALRLALGLAGGLVLLWIGARTVHTALRVRLGAETADETQDPRRAVRTAFLATLSNPLTILTWAALFSTASVAGVTTTVGQAAALVAGVVVGSFGVHLLIAGGWSWFGGRVGERTLTVIDVVAGLGVAVFGALLGWRALANADDAA